MSNIRTGQLPHDIDPANLFTTFGFVEGPAIVTAVSGPSDGYVYKVNGQSDRRVRIIPGTFSRIYVPKGARLESSAQDVHILISGFRLD